MMCEEQELYDLYLEQLERARRAARGELPAPNAGWMWPSHARPDEPAPAPAPPQRAQPAFVCDTPGE
jgi:hypothetical protein